MRDDLAPEFGVMLTPMMGNRLPADRVCAFDTGCFNQPERHDDAAYLAWLADQGAQARCLFATAPDVLGDAQATLVRSRSMLRVIRALGYKAALVAQDGLEDLAVPWDAFDCLFLGGTTAWKLSSAAAGLAREAKARDVWVHGGRVNTLGRLRVMKRMGCDSCDGTYIAYAPDLLGPRMARWVRSVAGQTVLDL